MRMGVFGVHATEPVQLIAFYKFDPYVVKMANRHEALNVLFKLSFVFDEINPASNSAINLISIAVSSKELTVNTNKIYAERIASEYSPRATSKVVALRKLDAKAKRPAHIFVYTFGIVSALFFLGGVGMCLMMGVHGDADTLLFVLGVVLGIVGIAGVAADYPLYKHILAKGKRKYVYDIIELAKQVSVDEV